MSWLDETPRPSPQLQITRLLCFSIYGGWIVLLALLLALAVTPSITDMDSGSVFAALLPYGFALYLWWFAGRAILRGWRRCAKCRDPLFGEPGWFQKKTPHSSAKRIWGSYFNSTAWQFMRTGSANCMWCGHRDGETPDYFIVR